MRLGIDATATVQNEQNCFPPFQLNIEGHAGPIAFVGRYLDSLTAAELTSLRDMHIDVVSLWQGHAPHALPDTAGYFTDAQGTADGADALLAHDEVDQQQAKK